MALESLFWSMLALVVYSYCLYPLIVLTIVKLGRPGGPPIEQAGDLPAVSVVISVFNEENVLEAKLKNLASLDYPKDKIEFLFGSDGSNDRTNDILSLGSKSIITLKVFTERRGKATVLNDLLSIAKGDIIVFSDANTIYARDTIRQLTKHFQLPEVGAVCGELVLEHDGNSVGSFGESSYWKYENFLKNIESRCRTILGATGGIYAIRKSLYRPLPTTKAITDDFLIPLNVLSQGSCVKYEPNALAYEKTSDSIRGEFRRKVRIGASNFQGLSEFSSLLHPRNGFVSFALWSHKIIRWCIPFLLIVEFCANIYLSGTSSFYRMILIGQLVFLGLCLIGFLSEKMKLQIGILGYPYYLLAMNAALFVGFWKFALGRQRPTWEVLRGKG